jgi:HMG (high mobility group) box
MVELTTKERAVIRMMATKRGLVTTDFDDDELFNLAKTFKKPAAKTPAAKKSPALKRKAQSPKAGTVPALRKKCREQKIKDCIGSHYLSKAELLNLLGMEMPKAKSPKAKKPASNRKPPRREEQSLLSSEINLPEHSAEKMKFRGFGKPRTAQKKDANAPKRPMNGYMFFAKQVRPDVVRGLNLSRMDNKQKISAIGKELGSLWRGMSDSEKRPYEQQAARDKQRYVSEMQRHTRVNVGEDSASYYGIEDDSDYGSSSESYHAYEKAPRKRQ